MKVVALVSGGKDSCYAMMRCLDYGHEIVALANLLPENDNVDELDSYMYQTVGHQIVEAYAQCMGLPLFRKRIEGRTLNSGLRYNWTSGDEVEDLEILLRTVVEEIPSVGAVCSGAIASDYQRFRVENVCSRLGLVSLAYLWKQNQEELLENMVKDGISAVLVKVAAIGLEPHKHLGKDLQFMQPILARLHDQYECNVCGEGGEYESLTLDCPLFKRGRIVLDEFNIAVHSPGSIAVVGVLHPRKFHFEPKGAMSDELAVVRWASRGKDGPNLEKSAKVQKTTEIECATSITKQSSYITISCWSFHAVGISVLLEQASNILRGEGLSWADALYIHLYLQSMKDFAQVNSLYSQYITELECVRGVPSRSTIEVPLSSCGLGNVMVEVLAARSQRKEVLHVQSISCWAPSCIGPYSQATADDGILFMAGQIGLDPPTMCLVPGGATTEVHQVLQNCEAVASSFGGSLKCSSVCLTLYCCSSLSTSELAEVESKLRCFLQFGATSLQPLTLFVIVSGLPKGASVELEPLLLVSKEFLGSAVSRVDGSFRYYTVPGVLCKVLETIDGRGLDGNTELDELVQSTMNKLGSTLTESGLCWSDVVAMRAYFLPNKVSYESLKRALSRYPEPLLIPVNRIGYDSSLNSLVAFDLLATRGI